MNNRPPISLQKYKPLSLSGLYLLIVAVVVLIITLLWGSFQQSVTERNQRSLLHARMIEGTVSRTFEALEISLLSISEELSNGGLDGEHLKRLQRRAEQILKFAPHIRQIVVVRGDQTLVDTRFDIGQQINLGLLGLGGGTQLYSHGLQIGTAINGRYLPRVGDYLDESGYNTLIPFAIEHHVLGSSEPFLILAAFNPRYLLNYISDLQLEQGDGAYLINNDGVALLQQGLYGPYLHEITNLHKSIQQTGGDERLQETENGSFGVSRHAIALRLVEKYPLAVVTVADHSRSMLLWLKQKRTLLLGLLAALVLLVWATRFIVRSNRKALQMREDVHLLSEVVEHSPVVVVITDTEGNIEYVNDMFEQITGYSQSEVVGRNPRFLKSGETSAEAYEDMWELISSGYNWSGEFHNKRKDGTLYWERVNLGPLLDDAGQITHYIALKEVINQEKDAAEKLRLASAVFSVAAEAIMVTDRDNRIQMVNESFARITGYAEEEVLGRNPSLLRSGKHPDSFYAELFRQLQEQGFWEGEIWNQRKNGEIYPQWLTISSRYNENGGLEGYVSLFSDITKRKHDEAIIIHQANYDALTGLPNRNLFGDRLSQSLALSDRSHKKTGLLFIDLDRFKYVNDSFGHSAGDQLLKQVASRLDGCVRKSDTVARLGGDEFAIVVPEMPHIGVVETIADKVLNSLVQPYYLEESEAYISCSIGIAIYPDNGENAEMLVLNADSAMYKAKAKGRNTREYYTAKLTEDSLNRHQLERELHLALEEQQFTLYFQPVWNLETQRVDSFEALIRWRHPERGLVLPGVFIALAEETGLINHIGNWVIDSACQFASQLAQRYEQPPQISLNVSSVQFYRGGVLEQFTAAMQHYQVRGEQLVVELTESILLQNEPHITEQLQGLVEQGIALAIDDFGTGYSSLSYLKQHPITRLKIDRAFVQELPHSEEDKALVNSIISMADALSLKVIVEGVETDAQLSWLRAQSNCLIQGFLLGKPQPATEALELLQSSHAECTVD